jgi:hypothetical protein
MRKYRKRETRWNGVPVSQSFPPIDKDDWRRRTSRRAKTVVTEPSTRYIATKRPFFFFDFFFFRTAARDR